MLLTLDDVTTAIADAARQTRPAESGLPRLVVTFTSPPDSWCGVTRPDVVDDRSSIRFKIDARPDGESGCPLTVDLYRTGVAHRRCRRLHPQGTARHRSGDPGGVVDFDQYVAARYGRLIEHAVLLGCAEGEAGTCVDQVLLEQRKRIRRAEDPDPLVREALERAIAGTPERRSPTGPLVALGLVAVAVAVGVALTYRPSPEPMPSLFALDGDQAQAAARGRGVTT